MMGTARWDKLGADHVPTQDAGSAGRERAVSTKTKATQPARSFNRGVPASTGTSLKGLSLRRSVRMSSERCKMSARRLRAPTLGKSAAPRVTSETRSETSRLFRVGGFSPGQCSARPGGQCHGVNADGVGETFPARQALTSI